MRGTVYRQCWCRDPETNRKLHGKCPDLAKKGHGKWYYRYEAPRAPGEKRRQPVAGPFETKRLAEDDLAAALARAGGGGAAADRTLAVAAYLTSYQASKVNLKERSRETDAEAFRLYWVPGLGHMRLAEVRRRHVEEVMREMMLVNRPLPDGEKPSEMLRRLLLARADDERRVLPAGEKRRKKSTKPLSPARVARMFAPFRAAMNAAVPAVFTVSPCTGAELPKAARVRPLVWTGPREAAFREKLRRREEEAELVKGKRLTTVEREVLWAEPALRPCPVMVWTPAHAGAFLDSIAGERLFALFALVIFRGLRRGEEAGLSWAEVDLDNAVVYVRETDSGDGPKSDAGTRAVSLPSRVVKALRAWRAAQAAERLGWGEAWTDTGLVFTHEDGTGVSGQWASRRLRTLAFRAGLPPVRFHDLRHGAASYAKAAGQDTKYISEFMGHSRASFTNDSYINLFPGMEAAMAEEAAAVVPEGGRTVGRLPLRGSRRLVTGLSRRAGGPVENSRPQTCVRAMCGLSGFPGLCGLPGRKPPRGFAWSRAEDRGFEPRMGSLPNRISSAVTVSPGPPLCSPSLGSMGWSETVSVLVIFPAGPYPSPVYGRASVRAMCGLRGFRPS